MTNGYVLVSAFEIAVGVVCLGVGALAWPHRARPAGTPLVALSLAAAGWGFTAGVASLVADPGATRLAQFGTYAVSGVAAVAWFYVVLEYVGRDEWARLNVDALAVVLVGADLLSLVTNPWHHLYVTDAAAVTPAGLFDPTPGALLWVHTAWKVGLVAVGLGMLIRRDAGRRGVIGLQSTAVFVAGLFPTATALLELVDAVDVPGLDFGVVGVAAAAVIVLWALFYADFLDVVPIARETMLASMTDAVVAVDTDGRVVDLNRRAQRLFGMGAGAIGSSVAAVLADYPDLLADGRGDHAGTTEIAATLDGEVRHYELESSPIRADGGWLPAGGERIGQLLVFRDVTVRRRQQERLTRKNARLEEFASVVSHDLRNPLNVAQGRVQLVREELSAGERPDEKHLAAAADALGRMERLIEELLTLAREGKAVEEEESVDLGALVRQCWRGVVTDEATLVVENERTVRADRSRLQALLENLLRNAVEHGGSDVTVRVGDLEDGTGFFVEDDGVGVPESERVRVLESGYTTASGGSGLGLAIVRVIAEAHGWTVEVTGSEAGGARFEFRGVESDG